MLDRSLAHTQRVALRFWAVCRKQRLKKARVWPQLKLYSIAVGENQNKLPSTPALTVARSSFSLDK